MKLSCIAAALALCVVSSSFGADYDFRFKLVNRTDPTSPMVEFELKNVSGKALKVYGVGADTGKARKPAYVYFEYKPKQTWKSSGKGAFGETAAEVVSLAPGEQRIVHIPLRDIVRGDAETRIGLRTGFADGKLWSEPVQAKDLQ
ncbi:hypothetical protein DES53_11663 [Roseimicrobium gellanilyticum]|uniref:Uncharacterized protein n=1 Tax=Roseimicrobium gellanilyticum TaxID=748857 RepID=A0A366H5H6_9BACT|nr:hypothetical protein [Roseimicrobium gellanilyticum]RBP36624.1 hypothetical protein DES53_11663 [Roseimicrobium gellanilyticum]